MKKALTLALVAALLTATGITAYATDITANSNPKTGGTTVNYTVDPAYTVVIPESVTLGDTAVTEQIKIYGTTENDNVVIGKGQKVNVALTASANNFNVANTDGDEVAYTVNDKNAVADLTTVAECTAAEGKKDTNITFTKTGTAAYAGTYTDTLTFTVSLEDAAVAVTGVTLNKTSTEMIVGNNETLTATVAPDDATDKTVTWKSSDATVASVDETGKVTAKKSGTATITVTATNGTEDTSDDKTDSIEITVNNPATGISLNMSTLELKTGGNETLRATVEPTGADGTVSWSSDNTSVATVDSNGKVVAAAEGEATITATIGAKSATCTVTVTRATTLANAFENGAVTKIVATNDAGTMKYIIEGTFNGSNFENVAKSGDMTDVMKNIAITKNGDKIVASIECIVGTYGTITLTFDTTNNTYTVNATGYIPAAPKKFGSISVNGENVSVSAS